MKKQLSLLRRIFFVTGLSLAAVIALSLMAERFRGFDKVVWKSLNQQHSKQDLRLVRDWESFLIENQDVDLMAQLRGINEFFNQNVRYKRDSEHWAAEDYWATPFESLVTGAGDCEDYVIAKYLSLVLLGVPDERLRMMYVTAVDWNEPHMVLIYLQDQQLPLVLDNLRPDIVDAGQRADLKPIYSFNANGFWMANASGLGGKVAGKKGVPKWHRVIERLPAGIRFN